MSQTNLPRLERVRGAIRLKQPDCVPLLYFNGDRSDSDIIIIDVVDHFTGPSRNESEWGFTWDRNDQTMGQPLRTLLPRPGDIKNFAPPQANRPGRLDHVGLLQRQYGPDRYYLASLVLTGFTIMTFLRGFENTLMDLAGGEPAIAKLADKVFGFEEAVIRLLKDRGFHGVAFYDDWGTQHGLMVSPQLWKDFFQPRYRRIFQVAHETGLDVYFHTCGMVEPLIEPLFSCGTDMLNLSQPNLYDIAEIGDRFSKTGCFVLPVSYQTTSLSGTREDIFDAVQTMIDHVGKPSGGLIGYVEEYESIGLSQSNYRACIEAFRSLGRYD